VAKSVVPRMLREAKSDFNKITHQGPVTITYKFIWDSLKRRSESESESE
jgi:hypothetical protein